MLFSEMNPVLVPTLADPNDGGALELHAFEGADDVREGVLLNPASGRWFPVHDGIPSLFVDALRTGGLADDDALFAERFEKPMRDAGCRLDEESAAHSHVDFTRIESERRARDEQAEDYDKMWSMRVYRRIETPAYRRALTQDVPIDANLPLLEAGCGTGRFTQLFAGLAAGVTAIDMSRDSILRNRVLCAGRTASPVHYIHADLTHLPLQNALFGAVAHCGVYEHIPSRAMREQFLQHARRVMAPGGALLLSAYRYGGLTKIFEQEGEHDGGIPFKRFTEAELRSEVETCFHIEKFRPSLGVYMSMLVAN